MKKILITGVLGFVGYNLASKLLKKGYTVCGIDNKQNKLNSIYYTTREEELKHNERFCLYCIDLKCQEVLNKVVLNFQPDIVFHFAACTGVSESIDNSAFYLNNNINSLISLLKAVDIEKIDKFIFASSSTVYQEKNAGKYNEKDELDNLNSYSLSKIKNEIDLKSYFKKHPCKLIVFRFFSVYGVRLRTDLFIYKLLDSIYSNKTIPIYDLESRRDFTYLEDILSALEISVERDVSGVYNLGYGKDYSLKEVIEIVKKHTGIQPHIALEAKRSFEMRRTLADNSKAYKDLGWKPQVDLESGILEIIEWFKKFRKIDETVHNYSNIK